MFLDIKENLTNNIDLTYKAFVEKIIPTADHIMGVRMPLLRKMATQICKGNVEHFIENYPCVSYEDTMLKGIVIAQSKLSINDKIKYLKDYVPLINNWGVCDSVVATLKLKEHELEPMYEYILTYRNSTKEYELRFLIVTMMYYYLKPEYFDTIVTVIDDIKVDHYYTNMAIAWLLSYLYFIDKDYTLTFLQKNTLDHFTYNKTLQKIMESNKITPTEKGEIKSMKR